ncbi:MAG: TMEM43 family protein [Chloroflexota bacterium]
MAERFTKITHTSWGSKIANSFLGALFGVLLFLGSFVVLWLNEGRTDWSAVARRSTPVAGDTVDRSADGSFVSVTGALASPETLGDEPYLRPGPYIQLERVVEMYAWVERRESETRDNVGGSSTTVTNYTYEKEWTTSPGDSSRFAYPSGHENPAMPVEGRTAAVSRASVGAYQIDLAEIDLPAADRLTLRPEMVTLAPGQRLADNAIYMGRGTPSSPQIGDVRISYRALAAGTNVTAFGTLAGDRLVPYMHRGEQQFYRALTGSREQAIGALRSEYVIMGWVLRLVGFLMMWIGLSLVFGPISAFLDVLPILGRLSGTAIGALTFGVSLVLTVVTVLIAIIAHNIVLLAGVLLLLLAGVYLWSRVRRPAALAAG